MNIQQDKQNNDNSFLANLKQIIQQARQRAYSAINFAQVEANWLLGQRIVEQEQNGAERAEYGKYVIKIASEELTKEFGSGFSERTLRQFRQFYLMFPKLSIQRPLIAEFDNKKLLPEKFTQTSDIQENKDLAITDRQIENTNFHLLSWTHIQRIMRVESPAARAWYLKEAAEQMWAVRTLDRNISTQYYERMLLSQMKEPVMKEMHEKTADFQQDKLAFIKEPVLPTDEELRAEIERQKEILKQQFIK